MKNNNSQISKSLLTKYINSIYNFEEYIKIIYSNNNNKNISRKGYIINLKEFENLKKIIDYDNNKNNISNEKINNIYLLESEKIVKIKQIEFKTSQYLINMILNKNKYIIINEELWKIIGNKENEVPIEYKINSNDIVLNLEVYRRLNFRHFDNKNILCDSNYCFSSNNNYKSNYDEIKRIYKNIK